MRCQRCPQPRADVSAPANWICPVCRSRWLKQQDIFGPGYHWKPDTLHAGIALLQSKAQELPTVHVIVEARHLMSGQVASLLVEDGGRLRLVPTPPSRLGANILKGLSKLGAVHSKESLQDAGWSLTNKLFQVRKL